MQGELFRVADFAVLCCLPDTEVLLQVHDKVSDEVGEVFEPSLCLPRVAGAWRGCAGCGQCWTPRTSWAVGR